MANEEIEARARARRDAIRDLRAAAIHLLEGIDNATDREFPPPELRDSVDAMGASALALIVAIDAELSKAWAAAGSLRDRDL